MADILYLISTIDNYNVFVNPHLDINTNLTTLVKVLENWKNNYPHGTFNFISSWFVYGDTSLPASEESECHPKGFYSITKRAAEQLLISYCETFNLKYRIIRLANVLGKTDTKVSAKKNALQFLINRMKIHEPIDLYEGGMFYRDYIHVDDVCQAIDLIIRTGQINTIYNVGLGEPILFKDIIDYAHQSLGSTSLVNIIEQKDFHKTVQVKSMWLKNDKLKALGFKPKYNTYEKIVDQLL